MAEKAEQPTGMASDRLTAKSSPMSEKPLSALLRGFEEACFRQDSEPAPSMPSWGGKGNFSIFDTEDVLGPGLEECPEACIRVLLQPMETASETAGHATLIQMVRVSGGAASEDIPGLLPLPSEVSEPHKLRNIRSACCVFTLTQDSARECSVCLEGMLCGEVVWTMPCLHQVHNSCAARYYSKRNVRAQCPMCRCSIVAGSH